jgi:hypothetical protein
MRFTHSWHLTLSLSELNPIPNMFKKNYSGNWFYDNPQRAILRYEESKCQIFKKIREPNIENTLFMVYMAERLYSARGDSQKVFKNLAKFMYDSEQFEEVSKMS